MSEKACAACGMHVPAPGYHPHLACIAFKQTRSSKSVEANIRAVMLYGMEAERAGVTLDEAMRTINWERTTLTNAKSEP